MYLLFHLYINFMIIDIAFTNFNDEDLYFKLRINKNSNLLKKDFKTFLYGEIEKNHAI